MKSHGQLNLKGLILRNVDWKLKDYEVLTQKQSE